MVLSARPRGAEFSPEVAFEPALEFHAGLPETTVVMNTRIPVDLLAKLLVLAFMANAPFRDSAASWQAGNAAPTRSTIADPHKNFTEGEAALQRGDLDAAEVAFRKVLAADPRAGAAYANLGVIFMRRKEWDHALALLQKAARLEPKMAGVRLNIGLIKYRSGDYAGALAPLASVVRDQPESQQARYLLGLCNVFTEHMRMPLPPSCRSGRSNPAISCISMCWESRRTTPTEVNSTKRRLIACLRSAGTNPSFT